MKISKKPQNVLFVEEETNNWVSAKSGVNKRLLALAILVVAVALLLSALR